jgi:2-methylcitrate dehydratase PrpD
MSMSGSETERLGEWAAELKFDGIPRRVVEECKNQLLSVIAAVHSGHFTEAGRVVSKRVKEWSGGKEATLIPSGERTSVHNAIYGNAALGLALDYDDYSVGGNTGISAVVTALALAEKQGVSGRDFLAAQTAANEIAGRLGAAAQSDPTNPQLESFVHLVSGAIVGARFLGLDKTQTASALGLALLQPGRCFWSAFLSGEGKLLLAAQAAPQGVIAADMAAGGLHGPPDALGQANALASLHEGAARGALGGLGSAWVMDTVSFKLYPGTAYADTIIDCILHLARSHTIDARKVKSIHVRTVAQAVEVDEQAAPHLNGAKTSPLALNYSIRYNAAAALIDKELTPRQFLREKVKENLVWDLAAKVHLAVDDDLARRARDSSVSRRITTGERERRVLDLEHANLANYRNSMGARVRIEMEDGRTFEAEEEVPQGGAGRSPDERRAAVEDKFRRETRYTLRKEKMERAIDLIEHIEEAASSHLREIVRLCCSERG